MLKAKKILSIVLALGIVAIMSIPVFAANTINSSYDYYLSGNGVKYTTARDKSNTSSTYVKITDTPVYYVYCDVQGYRPSPSGNGSRYWIDETLGGKAARLSEGEWEVLQYVKENGGNMARLKFQQYSSNGYVRGAWSPDCVGNYTNAN